MLSAEAVEHQLHVRAYASALAQFHAGCSGERIAQVLGRVLHVARIDGDGVVGGTLYPADACGGHCHGIQLFRVGAEGEVERTPFVAVERYFPLHTFISHGGDDEGIFALRSREPVTALLVRLGTEGSSFQVDGGKVDDFIIGRDDPSADEDASVMVAVALCMRRGDAGEAYQ